jgi:hypothetical protein
MSEDLAEVSALRSALDSYLQAYNSQNFEVIKNWLDEDCEVVFNGNSVMKGREYMLPSYLTDFESKATVTAVGVCKETWNFDQTAEIQVALEKYSKDGVLEAKLQVTYVFRTVSSKVGSMIKHVITI